MRKTIQQHERCLEHGDNDVATTVVDFWCDGFGGLNICRGMLDKTWCHCHCISKSCGILVHMQCVSCGNLGTSRLLKMWALWVCRPGRWLLGGGGRGLSLTAQSYLALGNLVEN